MEILFESTVLYVECCLTKLLFRILKNPYFYVCIFQSKTISWVFHQYIPITALSSHCGIWEMLIIADTYNPHIYRLVAFKKVIFILLLTYPHIWEYFCCHFPAWWIAIHFNVASLYVTRKPSMEHKRDRISSDVGGKLSDNSSYFTFLTLEGNYMGA